MNITRLRRTPKTMLRRITVIIPLICLIFILLASFYEQYYEDDGGPGLSLEIESFDVFPAVSPIYYNDSEPCLVSQPDGSFCMAFASNRSGYKDIWFTHASDRLVWTAPVAVTYDRYNDSDPRLLATPGGGILLIFESDRPVENRTFNGAYGPLDRYLWASFSIDGTDWRPPLQVTRNIFQQQMDLIVDSSPCLLADGERAVLVYEHLFMEGFNRTHDIVACSFDIGGGAFSQSMFDTYDLNFLDIEDHSMGTAMLQPGPDAGMAATWLPNKTLLVAYRGLCAFSNDLKAWTSMSPQNDTLLRFFNGLSRPTFFSTSDDGSGTYLYDSGSLLTVPSLNWTTWACQGSKAYQGQSIIGLSDQALIAHRVQSVGVPFEDSDIYLEKTNISTMGAGGPVPTLQASLVLGDLKDFKNQTLFYAEDGIKAGGSLQHFILAFDCRSGTSSDIMMASSADGHQWTEAVVVSSEPENESMPFIFQDEDRTVIAYRSGDELASSYSLDLVDWRPDTSVPAIPPAHTQYFKRDQDHHVKINDTGVWVSHDAMNWTVKRSIGLVGATGVQIDEDRLLVAFQEARAGSNSLTVVDLRFMANEEPLRIADIIIVVLFLVLVVLIVLAILFEIQR